MAESFSFRFNLKSQGFLHLDSTRLVEFYMYAIIFGGTGLADVEITFLR
jgi:hypothetical protein